MKGLHLLLAAACATLPVAAQLPSLDAKPWDGHFAAFESSRFTVGITCNGEIKVTPLNHKGEPFGVFNQFTVLFGVEEIMPDGSFEMKKIKAETLESDQEPSTKLEKVVIRGQVSANAAFEATIEQIRGMIQISGRVTEPGMFKKNPIRFGVQVRIPDTYPPWMREERWQNDRKAMAAQDKKLKADRLTLQWSDGKRLKQTFGQALTAASPELNGPGIAKAEIEIGTYKDRTFIFHAASPSKMTLSNKAPARLCDGFTIHWTPDEQGTGRFGFEVK